MAVAATTVIFGGDMAAHSIGTYGSFGRIELGLLSIPFTSITIIGITNAINLLDGIAGIKKQINSFPEGQLLKYR